MRPHRHDIIDRSRPASPVVMKARYPGVCSVTGQAIKPGDEIEYDRSARSTKLLSAADDGRYISNVIRTSGGTFYRNKNGRCEDSPCCGCCSI